MNFNYLHEQGAPLLIGNVWDVVSAKAAQKTGYQAIGTSSGAIAAMLGYRDGEEMSFSELEYIVQRILKSVAMPLTVDLEAGYSRNPAKIAAYIMRLADLGVVGVNDPLASRAVAKANGYNRISIIVPCHRVIGKGGNLTGYGGGIERKRWLLELEKKVISKLG